jgi:hypothetical protein
MDSHNRPDRQARVGQDLGGLVGLEPPGARWKRGAAPAQL